MGQQGVEVGGLAAAGVDADRALARLGVVARRLQGLPGALQEEPLLGVEDQGLAG